jgi:hypothetical protein
MTCEIAAFIAGTVGTLVLIRRDGWPRSPWQKLAFAAIPGLIAAGGVGLLT